MPKIDLFKSAAKLTAFGKRVPDLLADVSAYVSDTLGVIDEAQPPVGELHLSLGITTREYVDPKLAEMAVELILTYAKFLGFAASEPSKSTFGQVTLLKYSLTPL